MKESITKKVKQHLKRLPPKSSKVAPGDIVGGFIYVMDKPVGVEPGHIGISRDNPSYLKFVEEQLGLLKRGNHTNKDLQDRYNKKFKGHQDFEGLNTEEKINKLLEDKKHKTHRHDITKTDLKKIFFSFGKYHEVKAFQKYYENVGCGGLLFKLYKVKNHIKEEEGNEDHFSVHIKKLIKDKSKDKVHMVKQDGKMVLGRTGPNVRRLMKTEVGRKMQIAANPFVCLATAGISALVYAAGILGWRGVIMSQNKPIDANAAAIAEEVSTKIADIRGFKSQGIEMIEGTYEDGTPKLATCVDWSTDCRDLTGKLAGGEKDKTNVIVSWDKNGAHLKVDNQGNIIRTKKEGGKVTYEKVLEDGTTKPASKKEYDEGMAVSEDRIAGLGESLISFISMGDRDGIGEVGQNKVILNLDPPKGDYLYQFFGIDFGKAYEKENPIIGTLEDDFSIKNPEDRRSRFLNISILNDTPLREKMKGVYLLATLRNKLSPDEKEKIALEFEASGDKEFADRLRSYPESLFNDYGENIGLLPGKDPEAEKLLKDQKVKRWIKNGDLWWIKNEENKYREEASEAGRKAAEAGKRAHKFGKTGDTKLQKQFQKEQKHYLKLQKYSLHYADKLSTIYKFAKAADDTVLKVFNDRYKLTPGQIDVLEKLEKLTAKNVQVKSPDGKVLLNHLHVERVDRVAWQCTEKDGKFTLTCKAKEAEELHNIKEKLYFIGEIELKNDKKLKDKMLNDKKEFIMNDKGELIIKDLTQDDLDVFNIITEDYIANVRRDAAGFRTKANRDDFYSRLLKNDVLEKLKELTARLPEDRVAWECEKMDGKFTLTCQGTKNLDDIQNKLSLIDNNPLKEKIKLDRKLKITDLTQNDLKTLNILITKDFIEKTKDETAIRLQEFKTEPAVPKVVESFQPKRPKSRTGPLIFSKNKEPQETIKLQNIVDKDVKQKESVVVIGKGRKSGPGGHQKF